MNKNLLSNVIMFAAGAAIGSVVTWKFVETKYRQFANDEIESVKAHYRKKRKDIENDEEYANDVMVDSRYDNKKSITEYADILKNSGYVNNENEIKVEEGGADDMDDIYAPYVIVPEEFDTMDEWESKTLYYYSDGILADEDGNVITDIDDLVGDDFYEHFGDYEDDSVHIRNEELECDFEILRDEGSYYDAYPYAAED